MVHGRIKPWRVNAVRLLPISESLANLPGHVQAIREVSPQARHHFTRFDQVDQLVGASETDADLGFMARLMALCSLPRTNTGQGAFSDQLPFELGQRCEDAEHEAADRRGGVDLRALTGEHPQARAAGGKIRTVWT